eukprot:TRINITY_DN12982_c1_g1_i1.p1 TRINITY_DN12982_c1_g1~~TRINITY_DN12982_c1_g1_i1.p1  ORF type:complete len:126 (-),score=18.79 TRINITY_DN12982_c1_g1_i1:91-414(-)
MASKEEAPSDDGGPSGTQVSAVYSSRAEKMKQIRDQQRALDQAPTPTPPGLIAAGRAPRGQATIPASIEPLRPEPLKEEEVTWFGRLGYMLYSVSCCASSGRRDGHR